MSQEQDKVFFRNFSLVVGILAVLMIIFLVAARITGIDEGAEAERRATAVAEATAPIGEASVVGEPEQAPVAETVEAASAVAAGEADAGDMGKKVYDGLCISCHGSGIPGIPQLGDTAAWTPRIEQGTETLYNNAINGFTGSSGMMMPPRGGGNLSDEEVKAAVDYLVANSQ